MQSQATKKLQKEQVVSFEQSTAAIEENEDEFIEDRIINRKELESLGVLSFTFCVICQNIATPVRVPVVCSGCESAVFCQQCIKQWLVRSRECPYCKQQGTRFEECLLKNQFRKVYETAKVKCSNSDECGTYSLLQIEDHEANKCEHQPSICTLCNRFVLTDKISVQAHQALNCPEYLIQCEFCGDFMPRLTLLKEHQCENVYPKLDYNFKDGLVCLKKI